MWTALVIVGYIVVVIVAGALCNATDRQERRDRRRERELIRAALPPGVVEFSREHEQYLDCLERNGR